MLHMTSNQNITFSAPTNGDIDDVMRLFLDTYCKMDPLIRSTVEQGKTHSQELNELFNFISKESCESDYTILAKHDEQIIGVLTGLDYDKHDFVEGQKENVKYVQQIMLDLTYGSGEFNQLSDKARLLYAEYFIVSHKYQGLGIGSRMLEKYVEDARKRKRFHGIITEATGGGSQSVMAKHGFKTIGEVVYSEYKDKRGVPVFQTDDTNKSVKLMILYL